MVTPGGTLLGFLQRDHEPESVAKMLTGCLEQWKAIPRDARLLSEFPGQPGGSGWRAKAQAPEGGLVLEVFVRDLPRKPALEPKYANMWNHDYAWFTGEEVRSMIPESPKAGDRRRVPERLVRRLARLHLLDYVRGINDARPFDDQDVQKAEMFLTVERVDGDILRLGIEGATRAVEAALRPARPSNVDDRERGYESKMLGHASFDRRKGKFTEFELLAVGPRWGGRGYSHSMRQEDLGPQPMGFVFRLASPAETAEGAMPLHLSNYFSR